MVRKETPQEAHRNFPSTDLTPYELNFQAQYSIDEVFNMLKDGSYQIKFSAYISAISNPSSDPQSKNPSGNQNKLEEVFFREEELFMKVLTLSDVGKFSRFVIPKMHALKHFQNTVQTDKNSDLDEIGTEIDMDLIFYDRQMQIWKFRYCYWTSSKSFMFTKGWNKFVKGKGLEVHDTVKFYSCEFRGKTDEVLNKYLMIDYVKCKGSDESPINTSNDIEMTAIQTKKSKGFRLFGVQIVPVDNNEGN